MNREPVYCWVIIDRQSGEWVMRCESRDAAREITRGMSSFETMIAKGVPCR